MYKATNNEKENAKFGRNTMCSKSNEVKNEDANCKILKDIGGNNNNVNIKRDEFSHALDLDSDILKRITNSSATEHLYPVETLSCASAQAFPFYSIKGITQTSSLNVKVNATYPKRENSVLTDQRQPAIPILGKDSTDNINHLNFQNLEINEYVFNVYFGTDSILYSNLY